jgi:hypothetical protein
MRTDGRNATPGFSLRAEPYWKRRAIPIIRWNAQIGELEFRRATRITVAVPRSRRPSRRFGTVGSLPGTFARHAALTGAADCPEYTYCGACGWLGWIDHTVELEQHPDVPRLRPASPGLDAEDCRGRSLQPREPHATHAGGVAAALPATSRRDSSTGQHPAARSQIPRLVEDQRIHRLNPRKPSLQGLLRTISTSPALTPASPNNCVWVGFE